MNVMIKEKKAFNLYEYFYLRFFYYKFRITLNYLFSYKVTDKNKN